MLLLTAVSSSFAAEKYTEDKSHSTIGFTVKHMLISKVPGKFTDFSIEFMYDEKDISNSQVKAIIKTASITTNNEKRDEHLKGADFFDVKKYPEITFVSKEITKKDDGYVAKGTLTMKDVSKEIEIPFEILGKIQDNWGNTRLGMSGGLTINRQDYNVSWSKTLDSGGLVVSDDVEIQLDIELIKAK
jgi:polyisoprenoid-binding protein YceI